MKNQNAIGPSSELKTECLNCLSPNQGKSEKDHKPSRSFASLFTQRRKGAKYKRSRFFTAIALSATSKGSSRLTVQKDSALCALASLREVLN
jgi:hypothetical protein